MESTRRLRYPSLPRFSTRSLLEMVGLIAVLCAVALQANEVRRLRTELRELRQQNQMLREFVNDPPVRTIPLAKRDAYTFYNCAAVIGYRRLAVLAAAFDALTHRPYSYV